MFCLVHSLYCVKLVGFDLKCCNKCIVEIVSLWLNFFIAAQVCRNYMVYLKSIGWTSWVVWAAKSNYGQFL